ncbi:MAG: phospholipase D-like domain-containing protein [Polyangiales bacterium]
MSARDLDELLKKTLEDPRIPARTRREIERVFALGALDPDTVTLFCAQAIVLARASQRDPRMQSTFAWILKLAALAHDAPTTAAPAAPAAPPAAPKRAAGVTSRAFFSPGEDCLDAIRDAFDGATRTVDVCVFTITDDRIRDAMLAARRRGVALRVISDNDKSMDEGSDIEPLRRAGVEVRVDETEAHMHHKFAVIDGARLLNGSYNWTRSAARFNQENLVVTDDPALVGAFAREFERLWSAFASTRGPQAR